MTDGSAIAGRFAVALAGTLLALLLGEGLLSLSTGRSLRELVTGASVVDEPSLEWRAQRDADRIVASVQSTGLYRVHEDPMVGYTMRAEAELFIGDGEMVTDSLGMRVRPETQPSTGPDVDPLEIIVLGDSVAFGLGVDDDETLAHQLELLLNGALPPGSRPVICRTVAAPGWNHRNAVHFLLDHFDQYDPDIVLYLPISNDLANTYSVYATGHRRDALDYGSADPLLAVSLDRSLSGRLAAARRLKRSGRPYTMFREGFGPLAIIADISPESSRRYAENAQSIDLLHEQLTRRGAQLMLLQWGQEAYFWHLLRRVAESGLKVPVLELFRHIPTEFTLGSDPHSNATTLGVVAQWCAEALAEEGWVEGLEDLSVEAVPEAYAEARAPDKGPDDWRRESDSARKSGVDALRPGVNLDSGQGLFQVYGGWNADGSVRRHLLLMLPPGDGLLRLSLGALPGREDLLPQTVQVFVNGSSVGQVV
ncbi:MAG: hypothetical protein ACI9EF_001211, partial [Pseudohongiellaceae bacterium]